MTSAVHSGIPSGSRRMVVVESLDAMTQYCQYSPINLRATGVFNLLRKEDIFLFVYLFGILRAANGQCFIPLRPQPPGPSRFIMDLATRGVGDG